MEPESTHTFSVGPERADTISETKRLNWFDCRLPRDAFSKHHIQLPLVVLAYFIAGILGQATANIRSSNLGPVWPAYGVALAAILLCGYRAWIGVAVGAFLVAFLSPVPHLAAAGQAAGATVAALTGAFLLRRIASFSPSLSRLRDALGLIVFGAFGSALLSATIGLSALYATGVQAYSGLGSAWLIYWLGDSTGVLLVTPLVFTLPSLLRNRSWANKVEFAALVTLLTATCLIVFGDLPALSVKLHVLAFAVLPFVMWAAIDFGVGGAALSVFVIATIATVETALGSGPFAANTSFINGVLLDVFFTVLAVSGLTLASVTTEREHAEKERETLVREQAGREARLRLAAIVESSEDAIVGADMNGIITDWNNAAMRLYGYSADEVIGKPVSFLALPDNAEEAAEAMRNIKRGDVVKRFETVRRKKDGTRMEVSLTVFPVFDTERRVIGASAIVRDISERKHQEAALRESEERLRLATRAGRMFAYEWNAVTDEIVHSDGDAEVLGEAEGKHITGQHILNMLPPEDRERLIAARNQLNPDKPYLQMRHRLVRRDGTVIWVDRSSRAYFDEYGKIQRIVGMLMDVTHRVQAEEARADMGRKLLEAQEQERARIARELHDDISQQLGLLSVEILQMEEALPHGKLRSQLKALETQASEISADVQSLSHELHSSKLEYLGLVLAMKGFCKEFGDKHKKTVDFDSAGVRPVVPQGVALCLFRVMQEGLRNALKHSGVQSFEVELHGSPTEILLTVRDSGVGFEPELAQDTQGLGLISMRERVRLTNGTISITSSPQSGTEISVFVPLPVGTPTEQTRSAGA